MIRKKTNQFLILAYQCGYRVVKGKVFNPWGQIVDGYYNKYGYHQFSITENRKSVVRLSVHRLLAYQKYGDKIFEPGICVRHLDNNLKNNLEENISIGTLHESYIDRSPVKRLNHAIKAASKIRKFSDEQVRQIKYDYAHGLSYNDLMMKYDISSKGTISYLIKNEYVTKR